MSGVNKENGQENKSKVIPLIEGRARTESYKTGEESSLYDLVGHMRSLRESIPVNHQLRRELRARLLEGTGPQVETGITLSFQKGKAGWPRPWRLVALVAAVALCLLIFMLLRTSGEKVLEKGQASEVGRFWAGISPLLPAVSPSDGLIVVERDGVLLLLGREGMQQGTVFPPPGVKYSSPCWSPDGSRLALVRQSGKGFEIASVGIPQDRAPDIQKAINRGVEGAAVLAVSPAAAPVTHLAWSPDGKSILYEVTEGDGKGLYIAAPGAGPRYLGLGVRAAWSPDGSWLAVDREEEGRHTLRLVGIDGGDEYTLGQGSFPVWNKEGYLLFLQTAVKEKVLSYMPDGSPLFKVQQKTGEIRWIFLGPGRGAGKLLTRSGGGLPESKLLMAPDSPTGEEELRWLKSLELGGVRSPRTLYLDRSGEYEGLFPGDGGSLLFSRRDGDVVIITRVGLSYSEMDGRIK